MNSKSDIWNLGYEEFDKDLQPNVGPISTLS